MMVLSPELVVLMERVVVLAVLVRVARYGLNCGKGVLIVLQLSIVVFSSHTVIAIVLHITLKSSESNEHLTTAIQATNTRTHSARDSLSDMAASSACWPPRPPCEWHRWPSRNPCLGHPWSVAPS